jgi:hypothetical protein
VGFVFSTAVNGQLCSPERSRRLLFRHPGLHHECRGSRCRRQRSSLCDVRWEGRPRQGFRRGCTNSQAHCARRTPVHTQSLRLCVLLSAGAWAPPGGGYISFKLNNKKHYCQINKNRFRPRQDCLSRERL